MDVKSAAIQVLQQVGTALHAKEITERIMSAGLCSSEGKTPEATVRGVASGVKPTLLTK